MESKDLNFWEYSDDHLKSCLLEFVAHNNIEAVKLAVQKGVCVSIGDSSGVTPLHLAAESNNRLQCLIELLKSESVNIDSTTYFGDTPVAYSCQTNSHKTLKALIEHGANVDFSNFEKSAPLHIACWNSCLKTVMLLTEAGANVNAKDKNDWTPLHAAARRGHVDIFKYLLQHGADANIPNDKHVLPLHFGAQENCEVYDLIKSNTQSHTIVKYGTFPGPCGIDMVNRSILCLAFNSNDDALIKRVMNSGLPNDVLNCPVVIKQPLFINVYLTDDEEQQSFDKKLVLFTPLCFFLQSHYDNYNIAWDILKMLVDNDICAASMFKSSDILYVVKPIEIMLHAWCQQIERFKIITKLLENGVDPDEECNGVPMKLLKICILKTVDKSLLLLLLKASNVVEPEDILRWIIDNKNRIIMQCHGILDLLYALLLLSPYVSMSPSVCNHFVTLACYCDDEKNTLEKIRQMFEQSVRSLASYCRSIIRRQLHYETRNNPRKFAGKLNCLPVPNTVISYLKFDDVKFIITEYGEYIDCQINSSL